MPSRSRARANTSGRRRTRRQRIRFKTVRRFVRWRWRELRTFLRALSASPPAIRYTVSAALLLVVWLTVNWTYHAVHKPTEVLFPLDNALDKTLSDTWREYGPLFREHSTAAITPHLLAALAQAEGAGNPVARTYWRWQFTLNPFDVYRPASSAVGMFQITDGTFQQARRYCVHEHVVVEDGPWNDMNSCWFNSLYTRVLPTHAIELTAAYLDRAVAGALTHRRMAPVTPQRKQDLAAVIHLCGAALGNAYAARGFTLYPDQKCGAHDVKAYLSRVNAMKRQFIRLESGGRQDRLERAH